MEIKDFIKETLLQIVDGVTLANDELKAKGAYIPTTNVASNDFMGTFEEEKKRTKNHIRVDFDIAVALTQEETTKIEGSIKASGEAKLNIVPWLSKVGLGANTNGAASKETKDGGQTVHRIKCTIPLSLPESLNK